MIRFLRLALAAALVLATAPDARALSSNAGSSGAQFLKLGAGSRAAGMAESYSAIADDVYALYYNPAALTNLTQSELAASHAEHFEGINYEFAGYAYPFERGPRSSRHVLGAAIYNLSISDLERRIEDTTAPVGTFGAGDYAYNISYANRWSQRLSWGATGKVIHQTIDSFSSNAFAVDGGLLYRPRPDAKRPYALSLVMRNFGTRPTFAGVSDPLPLAFVMGAGMEPWPERVRVNLDLVKYRDTSTFFALGGEYLHPFGPELSAALRAGLTTHRLSNDGFNEISLGAGLRLSRASFDFAWVPFGALGNTFRYSLTLRFGASGAAKQPEEGKASPAPPALPFLSGGAAAPAPAPVAPQVQEPVPAQPAPAAAPEPAPAPAVDPEVQDRVNP